VYQNSTQFPAVTNRESWQQLIGVYDDNDGSPINLSNTSGSGIYSPWSVQVSATLYGTPLLTTTSLSNLTIGTGFFNAIVPTNLAIGVGQYVTFIYQNDTTQWITGAVTAYNPATGAISFNVTTVSIQLEIRRVQNDRGYGYNESGYGTSWQWGSIDCNAPILTASIGSGISIVDIGIFQIYFSEPQMRSLGSGMHAVNATLASADGIDVRQLFLGRLPVFWGGVTN